MAATFLTKYPINGIKATTDSIPLRQEVRAWASNNPIQLSLFVRALQKFYTKQIAETSPPSYFQVAGIHGYPNFFCAHNEITFPTWHRPYMLLFEQRIYEIMQEVIDELSFPHTGEKDQWMKERSQWRLPYFDWALPGLTFPEIFENKNISVQAPKRADGTSTATLIKENPLYRYQLIVGGKLLAMGDPSLGKNKIGDNAFKWSQCSGTSRWGITSETTDFSGITNVDMLRSKVQQQIQLHNGKTSISSHSIGDLVYRLLSPEYASTYRDFASTISSNQKPPMNWQGYLSLEMIHNNLHGFIGGHTLSDGMGHMQDPTVAAFDPIFYMHHCNIDRQFAIWQKFNDSWSTKPQQWFQAYSDPKSGHSDPESTASLLPFHKNDPNGRIRPWNSNDTHEWTDFGYQYDTIQNAGSKDGLAAALGVYNGTAKATARAPKSVVSVPEAQLSSTVLSSQHVLKPPADVASDFVEDSRPAARQTEPSETPSAPASAANTTLEPRASDETPTAPVRDSSTGLEEVDQHIYPDYLINIIYDRYALGGSPYNIHFFIGDVTDAEISGDASAFEHPRHVGSVYTFGRAFSEGDIDRCENCFQKAQARILSTAQVPLTIPLVHHAEDQRNDDIWHIDHHSVERYLTRHLSWKAVSVAGNVIPFEDIPRTRILALKGRAHHPPQPERMSRYYDYKPMSYVTHGKPCGASHHEYAAPHANL